MLPLLALPWIGSWVSRGAGGMKETEGKGAGFVSARNGGGPVGVGPF